MYKLVTFYDPVTRRDIVWSVWRPLPAEVVRRFSDKYRAYRPLQQWARDGLRNVERSA